MNQDAIQLLDILLQSGNCTDLVLLPLPPTQAREVLLRAAQYSEVHQNVKALAYLMLAPRPEDRPQAWQLEAALELAAQQVERECAGVA